MHAYLVQCNEVREGSDTGPQHGGVTHKLRQALHRGLCHVQHHLSVRDRGGDGRVGTPLCDLFHGVVHLESFVHARVRVGGGGLDAGDP
jgi:hypothetical protein